MHVFEATSAGATAPDSADRKFETTDLYLGAFLRASGMMLIGAQREGRRVTFEFRDESRRAGLVLEFYNAGLVRVNEFKNALQDLKAMVYNT